MKNISSKKIPFYNFEHLKAAYIHISDACNFRCRFCALPEKKKKSFVPLEKIKEKIKTGIDLGLANVILTGQETIIHPEIREIIRWSFEKAGVRNLSLLSNGLALSDDRIISVLRDSQKYKEHFMLGVSVNFYNAETFHNWSGHDKKVFAVWTRGYQRAVEQGLVDYIDVIMKKDMPIFKLLDFLSEITNGQSRKLNLRVGDLLPLNQKRLDEYREQKFSLLETSKAIKRIRKLHLGQIEFEAFPICVFNQCDLQSEKYYIPSFCLVFENGFPIQYDSLVFESFYAGAVENWLINKKKLIDSYDKMFYYLEDCRNCYYREKCSGIQREYIKKSSQKQVDDEIKLIKALNWK